MKTLLDLLPELSQDDRAAFTKMLHRTTESDFGGLGDRCAIVVVDMIEAFVRDDYPTGWAKTGEPCAIANAKLLEVAREQRMPIIYTTGQPMPHPAELGGWLGVFAQDGFPFCEGDHFRIVAEIEPTPDDIILVKPKPSAFFGTQLQSILTYLRADTVIVTGMTTSGCVRATVNDAFMSNYRTIIPIECVADRSQLSHRVELLDMAAKYASVYQLADLITELKNR